MTEIEKLYKKILDYMFKEIAKLKLSKMEIFYFVFKFCTCGLMVITEESGAVSERELLINFKDSMENLFEPYGEKE